MIRLGLSPANKAAEIRRAIGEFCPSKVFLVSPSRFHVPGWTQELTEPETETTGAHGLFIDWPKIIEYRWYYRLIQEVDAGTLLILNEPLRTQARHNLSYNCLRNWINQAGHVLVFSSLPIIDTMADFMILVDFVTRSKWRREPFAPSMLCELDVTGAPLLPDFVPVQVQVSPKILAAYAATKERLMAELRADCDKDPHQLPRNLHLAAGPAKVGAAFGHRCIGRNDRFHLADMETYRTVRDEGERTVFEWPHNFIDYADALAVTRAPSVRVLVADTPADRWYFDRYTAWSGRVRDAAATIHG